MLPGPPLGKPAVTRLNPLARNNAARVIQKFDHGESLRGRAVRVEEGTKIGFTGGIERESESGCRRSGIILIELYSQQIVKGLIALEWFEKETVSTGVNHIAPWFRIAAVVKRPGDRLCTSDSPADLRLASRSARPKAEMLDRRGL